MNADELFHQIITKESFLCVGLDVDQDKIPSHLFKYDDPVFEFNKAVIDATHDLIVACKPNMAFYEAMGIKGLESLQKTTHYIKEHYPELLLIGDAKRGDIGNTARMYAKSLFEHYRFDAVTLSPYMGRDSIYPFLEYEDKWAIVLAVTSNKSANDFQLVKNMEGQELFIDVIQKAIQWGGQDRLMFVAGATRPDLLEKIRAIAPEHFLLVPGVGAQGGDLKRVAQSGMNSRCGLLVNSSRGIILAGNNEHFAQDARIAAHDLYETMRDALKDKGVCNAEDQK